MEYLLKASAIIAVFYICYKVFLQKETFFQSNRWFLLSGLIVAFVFPLITIPIYIEAPIRNFQNLAIENVAVASEPESTFNFLQLVFWIYILGVVFFLGRFIIQILSLRKLFLKTSQTKEQDQYVLLKTNDNVSPFSFFKWIFYNPNQFDDNELNQVLNHEKVHVRQHHSVDILISQISTIIFWFNPFIWLYKKDVQQNLEFIADYYAQRNVDCKKSYQYLLLKSSIPTHQLGLTNNFYNSLIKKRIVMLHKSKSKQANRLKYLIIIPFISLFLMSFNTKKVFINSENAVHVKQKSSNGSTDNQMVIITKDFTDNDFDKVKEQLKKEGLTIKFKSVKRNESGEITSLKIDVSSKQSNANYNINGDEPIKPIKISFDREGGNISIGNTSNYHFGKGTYSIKSKDGKHIIHSSSGDSNEFEFDDDEEDVKVHIVDTKKGKKIHTVASNNKVFHLDSDEDIVIIKKDKDGNIVKEKIIKSEDEDVLIVGDDNSFKVKSIGKGDNKFFFVGEGEGDPLIIIDGNEASEEEMKKLDPDEIEKMEVLKGNSATKEYGEKGENGVVLITTK